MPTLLKYGASYSFAAYVVDTVAMQMNSLLRHWDDRNFRNTILLLGLEEGSFYEPVTKTDIRCFVVVTLRNSPIEVLQSDAYADAGLKDALKGQDVKAITSAAVQFFSEHDFKQMSKLAKTSNSRDLYCELKEKYSVAWAALQTAATTSAKAIDYPKQEVTSPYVLEEIPENLTAEKEENRFKKVLFDGYDPTIEQPLIEMLKAMTEEEDFAFITDSFKALTRNAEKLFRIMEFLLSRDCEYVTSNFYLKNGHVEKRIKPLRAGHTVKEMQHNLMQTADLGYRHKRALTAYMKQILEKESD